MEKFETIGKLYCVSDKIVPVSKEEIQKAEENIGGHFPAGYGECLLKFGEGEIANYIHPFSPKQVVDELEYYREILLEDFWDDGSIQLDDREKNKLVVFADTIDGDLFAFDPGKAGCIYCFPRNDTVIFKLGPTFEDMIKWASQSEMLTGPFACTFFQPMNNYASIRFKHSGTKHTVSEMKTVFETIGDADHISMEWAESLHYFIKKFGAHLDYSIFNYDDIQFVVTFDSETAVKFLPLLAAGLMGRSFTVSEAYEFDKKLLKVFD
jgi:hypothetical protein